MKTIILAGGYGTRISEESQYRPKPMIEIGGKPILWHIMKEYSHFGYNEFIICAGYKQHIIKEYFSNYVLYNSDLTFDFQQRRVTPHNNAAEDWHVTVVDTGLNTMTGGRLKRVEPYIGNETFMLTYGDGVCDVPINKLVAFHQRKGKIATLTAVHPESRFGFLDMADDVVTAFREKSRRDTGYINGGYMVLEPDIFSYLEDDSTIFEKAPMERLVVEGEIAAFKHDGFWQCMDTLREQQYLESLWEKGAAPWKTWQ